MTLWMPNKKKPLYAPMLASFGGGSVRGFKGAGSGIGAVGSAISTLDMFNDGSCISCINMDTMVDLNSSNNFTYAVQSGGQSGTYKKWGTYGFGIPNGSTGDYIYTEGLDLSNGGGDFTLSAWFRLAGARSSGIQPVMMVVSGSSTTSEGAITVASANGNNNRYYGKGVSNNTSLDPQYATNTVISTGVWYHGVHTYNATTNEYKIYLNGNTVNLLLTVSNASSTGSQPVGLSNSSNVDILLGHEPDSFHSYGGFDGGQNIDGHIDQVRIFDRVLDATEIDYLREERLVG